MIDLGKFSIYFGYAMAALFCCLGITVLFGGLPGLFEIPLSKLSTLVGLVMLMYSVFRFITTRNKAKQNNEDRTAHL